MEENAFDKLKSMLNNGNIPDDLKSIMSNISSSNKNNSSNSQDNSISPETIGNLMAMLNSNENKENTSSNSSDNSNSYSKTVNNEESNDASNNFNIDFETVLKFKSIIDKMNSKDDPRAKLLISLKPYLKDSRKSKVDQYIQFFNMSKVIDVFSKYNGDGK